MAGERTLPNLNLTAGWDLGDNTWKPAMDLNFATISVLLQGRVLSQEATEPGSPSDGEVYIATGIWGLGNPGDIIYRDNGAWVVITPLTGWLMYQVDTAEFVEFDGADWVTFAGGSGATDITRVEHLLTPNAITNAQLGGNYVIIQNSATGTSELTIASGMVNKEPVTIINQSGGTLTITAGGGVTIHAANDVFTTSIPNASVTLIPGTAADEYFLIGALDAPA